MRQRHNSTIEPENVLNLARTRWALSQRSLGSSHSISIGDRQSAHREAASFNEVVSERPTWPPEMPRSVPAFRIQPSSFCEIGAATLRLVSRVLGLGLPGGVLASGGVVALSVCTVALALWVRPGGKA